MRQELGEQKQRQISLQFEINQREQVITQQQQQFLLDKYALQSQLELMANTLVDLHDTKRADQTAFTSRISQIRDYVKSFSSLLQDKTHSAIQTCAQASSCHAWHNKQVQVKLLLPGLSVIIRFSYEVLRSLYNCLCNLRHPWLLFLLTRYEWLFV